MTFTAIGDIYINWVSSPHQDSALSVFLKSSAAIERAVAITNEQEWDPLWKAGQVKCYIMCFLTSQDTSVIWKLGPGRVLLQKSLCDVH